MTSPVNPSLTSLPDAYDIDDTMHRMLASVKDLQRRHTASLLENAMLRSKLAGQQPAAGPSDPASAAAADAPAAAQPPSKRPKPCPYGAFGI